MPFNLSPPQRGSLSCGSAIFLAPGAREIESLYTRGLAGATAGLYGTCECLCVCRLLIPRILRNWRAWCREFLEQVMGNRESACATIMWERGRWWCLLCEEETPKIVPEKFDFGRGFGHFSCGYPETLDYIDYVDHSWLHNWLFRKCFYWIRFSESSLVTAMITNGFQWKEVCDYRECPSVAAY